MIRHRRLLALLTVLALVVPVGLVALAAVAEASPRAAATPTQRVVVRPVHADGAPAAGWSVTRERGYSVQCWGPSASGVTRGISTCGASADYLPSCWKSRDHTVLCVRDVRTKKLVRVRYTGAYPAAPAPARPSPQGLQLGDGERCAIRIGGAWGSPPSHPQWVGWYSCTRSSVYGPESRRDGIIRSTTPWKVDTWVNGTEDRIVRRNVTAAYYVGTRR